MERNTDKKWLSACGNTKIICITFIMIHYVHIRMMHNCFDIFWSDISFHVILQGLKLASLTTLNSTDIWFQVVLLCFLNASINYSYEV